MSSQIILHPAVIEELQESCKWHEDRAAGLGIRFMSFVNKRLKEIAEHPERYAKKKGNYREIKVEVFPYAIIYEVLKKEHIIFVSYIFHAKQNPSLKYRRLH